MLRTEGKKEIGILTSNHSIDGNGILEMRTRRSRNDAQTVRMGQVSLWVMILQILL